MGTVTSIRAYQVRRDQVRMTPTEARRTARLQAKHAGCLFEEITAVDDQAAAMLKAGESVDVVLAHCAELARGLVSQRQQARA